MQLDLFTAARNRTPRRRSRAVPVPALFAAWADPRLTFTEIARKLDVTDKQLRALAKKHALPKRPATWRPSGVDDAPDAWGEPDEQVTCELSPWVQARIRELNIEGEWSHARRFD